MDSNHFILRKKVLKLIKKVITNTKDFDIYVRDAFGMEHTIFPRQSKKIIVLRKGSTKK